MLPLWRSLDCDWFQLMAIGEREWCFFLMMRGFSWNGAVLFFAACTSERAEILTFVFCFSFFLAWLARIDWSRLRLPGLFRVVRLAWRRRRHRRRRGFWLVVAEFTNAHASLRIRCIYLGVYLNRSFVHPREREKKISVPPSTFSYHPPPHFPAAGQSFFSLVVFLVSYFLLALPPILWFIICYT